MEDNEMGKTGIGLLIINLAVLLGGLFAMVAMYFVLIRLFGAIGIFAPVILMGVLAVIGWLWHFATELKKTKPQTEEMAS